MITRQLFSGKKYGRSLVEAHVSVAIGATGAVGAITGKGISVARTGTGAYTATVAGLMGGVGAIVNFHVDVVTNNVAGYQAHAKVITPSAGTVTFNTEAKAAPGTPADPSSGSTLLIHAVVRNSSSDRT
jgi:hypothetical protein